MHFDNAGGVHIFERLRSCLPTRTEARLQYFLKMTAQNKKFGMVQGFPWRQKQGARKKPN